MGLSRRGFINEFTLAAVRRLERGSSIREAARALEASPKVLRGAGRPRQAEVHGHAPRHRQVIGFEELIQQPVHEQGT